MAMIKCPECGKEISDKAMACPNCGYPMNTPTSTKPRVRNGKPTKLPNGYGSVYHLSGKRRKPFAVRKTDKWIIDPDTGRAKQTYINIGYYATREEAMIALADFNKNPYDLDASSITVQELYEKWIEQHFQNIEESSQRTISSAWTYCSPIYSMRIKDLRARHIKGCMEDGYRIETRGKKKGEKIYPSAGTKSRIKSLFNQMLDFALEYELVDRNYARTFEVSEDISKEQKLTKNGHIIFTEQELQKLWDNVDRVKFVDWILIQNYMGWRPQEIAKLRLEEINLDNWTIRGGMKTEAGKQRVVPIHTKIRTLVKKNYEFAKSINSEYLLNDKGQTHSGKWNMTYDKYANRFNMVISELDLNPEHKPHDPRKTFSTRAQKAGVSVNAVKALIGHKAQDITESAYTERDIEWLRKDIEKMS